MNALTGKVGPGTQVTCNPTYQELRHFADRLLRSWTVNFRLSITRARTLSANWFARACSRAREAASQCRYSLLIRFFAG